MRLNIWWNEICNFTTYNATKYDPMGNFNFLQVGITISLLVFFTLNTLNPPTESEIFPPDPERIEISNLKRINSAGTDFSPIPYRNGLVFTSSRGDNSTGIFKEKFFDLYFSQLNESGNYVIPSEIKGDINSELHDGTATFTPDGKTMYFTRNRERTKGLVALKVYSSELIDGEWKNVKELAFNSEEFSNSHPTISPDGDQLFFASDRPGGFGGMDIYMVEMNTNGKWGKPRNLGLAVNSDKNEVFPFLGDDYTLYYASDCKGGRGKLDIYMSEPNRRVYGQKKNLGAPFNSSADDFGFFIEMKKEFGYFSSNRSGGLGKDDIYKWNVKEDLSKSRRIILVDKLSGKRIGDAEIRVKAGMEKIGTERLEETQQGVYKIELDDVDGYTFNVDKYGYKPLKLLFKAEELIEKDEHTFYLNKKSMSLLSGNVMKKVDSSTISQAKVELINECDGRKQFATTTVEGKFGFSLICDCEYTIVVNKVGYKTNHIRIPLHKNKCSGSNLLKETLTLESTKEMEDRASIDP